MAAAVNADKAGQGHSRTSRQSKSGSSPSALLLLLGEMCRKPQFGQSSSTWLGQTSDHA
jgi:hypothetical protein